MPKILLGGVFILFLLLSSKSEKINLGIPLIVPSLLFIAISLLGLVIKGEFVFLKQNFLCLVGALFVFNYFSGIDTGADRKKIVRKILVLSLLIVSLFGILQHFGFGLFEKFAGTPLPYSSLGHRNYLSDYIILLLPFLFLGIEEKRLGYIFILLIALWALLISKSFRAIPSLIVLLFVYTTMHKPDIKLKKIYRILLAVFIFSTFIFLHLSREKIIEENLAPRLFRWSVSLDIYKDYPILGAGLGRFSYMYPEYQSRFLKTPKGEKFKKLAASPERANNEYIHFLAETGLLGFISLILLLSSVFMGLRKSPTDNFSRAAAASLAGIAVSAFFGYPFHRPEIILTLILICGLAIDCSKCRRIKITLSKFTRVLLSLFLFFYLLGVSLSQILHERAIRFFNNGKYLSALETVSPAILLSPIPGELLFFKGRAEYRLGLFNEAIESYTSALATYNNSALYYNRGLAYMLRGDMELAKSDFKKTLSILPKHSRSKEALEFMQDISYENMLEESASG
ncbi:MAG: hypothetical protein GX817_06155 [Elusimicrobia bacterium]|nr:hypothetical protein [Elusimicrobiota bacterium]